MYIKIHYSYRNTTAICDSELIGKKFEEDIRQLELKENFYKDKKVNQKEAIKIIQKQKLEDATFNIVGKKSIKAALDAGLITKENIDSIQGIPFAMVLF